MKRFNVRACALGRWGAAALAAAGWLGHQGVAWGAVTALGNVAPAPPAAGGNVAAPFKVGDTGNGTLSINAGSPLNVTGGSALVGDSATGVGIVVLADLNSVLTTADDLVVGNLGVGSVTVGSLSRVNVGDILFLGLAAGSSGDLFVNNFGALADVGDSLVVASSGNALVQLSNGGLLRADDALVGQFVGSDGRVTVSGNASNFRLGGAITIGDAGRGEMQVVSQATATTTNVVVGNAATGAGVAVVSGAGSIWNMNGFLTVGSAGLGTLNVLDGAQTTTTGAFRLAATAGGEGHGIVSGVNAVLSVGSTVTVGELGFGTMDVRASARLNSGNVIIADNGGSRGDVLVDGAGSLWKITGTLDVSDPGEAQLAISSGGQVTTTGVARVGAAGRLLMATGRLDAAGGLTNNGLVQGTGRITGNVTNAATGKLRVPLGNTLILAGALTNAGVVDVDGGELEVTGAVTNTGDVDLRNSTLRVGGAGLANNNGSQVAITEGTVDVFGNVTNSVGGQIVVGGHATAVFHDNLTNNGQFFVLPGAEVVALENLSFTPTSMLSLQLGLLDESAEAGQVESAAAASLAGSLAVSLAAGYTPEVGDEFPLITTGGGLSGTFASASLPSLGGGLAWELDYEATSLMLSVVPGLTADFDGDGDVDSADLAKWRTGFGKATGAIVGDGDADADGDVDGADFLAWQRELGSSVAMASSGPAGSSVPEPHAAVLLMLACAAVNGSRRRHHSGT